LEALGAMVVRFPAGEPWDNGWHIDGSFPSPDDPASLDYFQWRVNYMSRSRAMLMLFLFSDCGPTEAPTRVRIGSHLPMVRQLLTHGEAGISLADLAREGFESSAGCDEAWRRGMRARCGCCILSPSTRRRRIAAGDRASWRSPASVFVNR
jgi:hypothetical protein